MADQPVTQRRDRRLPVRVPVRISTIDAETDAGSGRRYFRASRELCTNLSRGGVFVRTADPLQPGRRVVVELDLPGGTPFEAVGRIAWSTHRAPSAGRDGPAREGDGGVGVQFLGGEAESFDSLDAFLESLRARQRLREPGPKRRR